MPHPVRSLTVDALPVDIFATPQELAAAAAQLVQAHLAQTLARQGSAAAILATGNSQLQFLDELVRLGGVDWSKITLFHMDEYLGMPESHPASFRRFLREKLVERVHPKAMYGMQGDALDVAAEIRRYVGLLEAHPPVVCVMGIGENGHIAFNDPPADFHTREIMHVVNLDEACRRQQVGEGHFARLEDVPRQALSLTVPALLKPPHVMALVPEARKAAAVRAALQGPVTENCPASILRTQPQVTLYLDRESAGLLR